ncbi:hypothetical protein LR48_Vigan04g184300 [Vigna angularis]|uniref:Uncharacterized protein n=1 Tax=Phaseolus angularis TaxID=3914 RepID=A0A0L9UFG1_PHAAN|nr:hypothetical protein LR48_Vigan04g184300 [Vigna angularis]
MRKLVKEELVLKEKAPSAHGDGDNSDGGRSSVDVVLCAEPAAVAEGGGGQQGSRRRRRRVEIEQIGAPKKAFKAADAGSDDASGVDRNSETLRFTYSETFRKWPIGDLAFGINYFMRKKKGAGFWGILTLGICVMVCILQGNLAVASVYAGSDSVQLKGDGIIVELYQDMIMEILLWLPVKDLLRFKCVSKGGTNLFPIQFLGLRFCKGDDNEDEDAVAIWGWKGFPNWFSVFLSAGHFPPLLLLT